MQTLGITDSTPASENRLKNLFWPTIRTGSDVDTLGSQGYWICTIVAVLTFVFSLIGGHPIAGFFYLLFYYLGAVGVREQSCYAAVVIFVMFLADTVVSPGIVRFFGCVLLLSVLRATFVASFWEPEAVAAEMPIRFSETWGDKFVDKLPAWLWPKIRIGYYAFSICFLVLAMLGMAMIALQRYRLLSGRL